MPVFATPDAWLDDGKDHERPLQTVAVAFCTRSACWRPKARSRGKVRKSAVVIAGMHRSGTSLATRVLNLLGESYYAVSDYERMAAAGVRAVVEPTATPSPAPTQPPATPQASPTPARSTDPAAQPLAMLLPRFPRPTRPPAPPLSSRLSLPGRFTVPIPAPTARPT